MSGKHPMVTTTERLANLDGLRGYVNRVLCEHDNFEHGAFPVTERILVRGDQPCGIFFCLHGPRSVKVTAVWETQSNSILFYNSTGERYHRARLANSIAIPVA
jgi:hypothetical protein